MSPDQEPKRSTAFRKGKDYWLSFTAITSGFMAAVTARSLTKGPYPTDQQFVVSYLMYSAAIILFLHATFFEWNRRAKLGEFSKISRNTPKYLEYIYALLLSFGLLHVFFMRGPFSEFVAIVSGDEATLVNKIVQQASKHLTEKCSRQDQYFTAAYCDKLKAIVAAKDTSQYIVDNVLNDDEFLSHEIGRQINIVYGNPQIIKITSPIWQHANALKTIREYARGDTDPPARKAMSWLAFMLLPVGIGLRILKTSLELYADLE